jgi:predicted PurR-regulated permease PerM
VLKAKIKLVSLVKNYKKLSKNNKYMNEHPVLFFIFNILVKGNFSSYVIYMPLVFFFLFFFFLKKKKKKKKKKEREREGS